MASLISSILNWECDYHGQLLAERLGQFIMVGSFALGTVVGFIQQSLYISLIMWVAGVALTIIVCVPPWPIYQRHPIKWRPARFRVVQPKKSESEQE